MWWIPSFREILTLIGWRRLTVIGAVMLAIAGAIVALVR